MNKNKYIIAIDIGKTNITFGLFDLKLNLIQIKNFSSGQNKQEILTIIEELIKEFFDNYDIIVGISLAAFGVIDSKNGVVLYSGSISDWNNVHLKNYFESIFKVPVFVENDVNAAIIGESYAIKNSDTSSLIYLSVGSNIAVAYMNHGVLLKGTHQALGEVNRYIPKNSVYNLGELIGGKGISKQYFDLTNNYISCKEIFALADEKNQIAIDIRQRMIDYTVELLYLLCLLFDPGYLLIGGGVVSNNTILFNEIKRCLDIRLQNSPIKLQLANYGDKSGVYGAAKLCLQQLENLI